MQLANTLTHRRDAKDEFPEARDGNVHLEGGEARRGMRERGERGHGKQHVAVEVGLLVLDARGGHQRAGKGLDGAADGNVHRNPGARIEDEQVELCVPKPATFASQGPRLVRTHRGRRSVKLAVTFS